MKKILTRKEYLGNLNSKYYTKYTNVRPINEVFENEINWGDSLIGRLFNSIARKVGIAYKMKKISDLKVQLRNLFEQILYTGQIGQVADVDTFLFNINAYLTKLSEMVKNEDTDTKDIIDYTLGFIDFLEDVKLKIKKDDIKRNYSEKEINKLIEALKEFVEFLKTLKVDSSQQSMDDEEKDDTNKDNKDIDTQTNLNINLQILQNSQNLLKSVIDLGNLIQSKQPALPSKPNLNITVDSEYFYNGKVVKVKKFDTQKTKAFIIFQNPLNKIYKEDDNQIEVEISKLKPLPENIKNISKTTVPAISQNKNESIDYDLFIISQIFENIEGEKVLAKILKQWNTIGMKQFIPMIQNLLEKSKIQDSQEAKDICIISKQVIMNKITVGKLYTWEQLIKEELKTEISNDIPKAISLLSKYIIPLKEHKNTLSDKPDYLKVFDSFILSFENLEKLFAQKKELDEKVSQQSGKNNVENNKMSDDRKEDKQSEKSIESEKENQEKKPDSQSKKESDEEKSKNENLNSNRLLLRYGNFLSIFEKNSYHQEILSKFNELLTKDITDPFYLDDDTQRKLKNIKAGKDSEFVFTDADLIIEITRLFHRAFRLTTPGAIPSGRKEGRVSVSVFNEYEYIGSSSEGTPDRPGGGPYRNKKLWDSWLEGVQDILSDTSFRPIFSEKAVFKFKNEQTGKMGDPVKGGGKILFRFVNSLISDSKMYGAGRDGEGAMSKFLKEYFGLGDTSTKPSGGPYAESFLNDMEVNAGTTSEMKETKVKLIDLNSVKFTDTNSSPKIAGSLEDIFLDRFSSDKYKNLAFYFESKKNNKVMKYWGTFLYDDNGFPIILFCSSGYPYTWDKALVSGDIKEITSQPLGIYLASLPKTGNGFKSGGSIKLFFINIMDSTLTADDVNGGGKDRQEFKLDSVKVLCDSETSEPYLGLRTFKYPTIMTDGKMQEAKKLVAK